jgi:serine-type D-Ala-D-Ala carboxypeptidase/endopeptidase
MMRTMSFEGARAAGGHATQTLAAQAMAATGSVGCAAVFISAERGSPALRSACSAAGRSGRRGHPIGPDTRFEIGSVTKIFTGLILADMAVRKEVDLDTPLGSLIEIPVASAVTLRSLATHTSGLPRDYTGRRLAPRLAFHPNPYRDIGLDRVAAALARKPPAAPGTYRYSNLGYQLLAAALAAGRRRDVAMSAAAAHLRAAGPDGYGHGPGREHSTRARQGRIPVSVLGLRAATGRDRVAVHHGRPGQILAGPA